MMYSKKLKLIVVDVDGTLTDAGVYYDEQGNELKKFCTRDAAAFFVARELGIDVMVLTGRECKATERRMTEMKAKYIIQDVKDKHTFLKDFLQRESIESQSLAYIGDDINDFSPMQLAGIKACPADSCKEIKMISDYISPVKGGYGVFRDIAEFFLFKDEWCNIVKRVYHTGF